VDFIAADIITPPSGSSVDAGGRTARATASSNAGAVRKTFSTVLQRARGEGERSDAPAADEARPVNKFDDGSRLKEARGSNVSSTRGERADASPSRATDESRSTDDKNNPEDAKTVAETTGQESNASSHVQGQEASPPVTVIPFQPTSETIGHTDVPPEAGVHAEEGENSGVEVYSSETGAEGSGVFSTPQMTSSATTEFPAIASDSFEDPPAVNKVSTPWPGLPEQELDATAPQPKDDSRAGRVVQLSSDVAVDGDGTKAASLAEHAPLLGESQPGSALVHLDSVARRVFQAYLGAVSSHSKSEPSQPASGTHEEVSHDHALPTPSGRYAPSLNPQEDRGVKTGWVFPHGQQPSFEGAQDVNEFWNDGMRPLHDQSEGKLPQAAIAEPQLSSGQSTETAMAGAHGRAVSGQQAPSLTGSFVSGQALPAATTHDAAEQAVRGMTRSVVFDVAQPDLGHVNIRVAMSNDVVHTHLSADRPEVGHFLINGQDRLQAALQANGLDMGQFRVDIDRQSAGRSFHHGPSQEQGQAWNQDSQEMKWGSSPDLQDEQRASLHGLLNVVA
jgi:hypothetical protein